MEQHATWDMHAMKVLIRQLGGLVVKILACCAGEVPGSIPGRRTQHFPWTFISKIPAGCRSDETLNWRPLVLVSMLGK